MQKLLLKLQCGDEYAGTWQEYVAFEAESKEYLCLDINCALLDFQKRREILEKERENLVNQRNKLETGSHKKAPDLVAANKISDLIEKNWAEHSTFKFGGRLFDSKYFFYNDVEEYNTRSWKLIEVSIREIETLDEFFKSKNRDFN